MLRIPVLLVAGSYVGTISHTLTALDVLARRNLDVAAVVVSESEGSAALARRTPSRPSSGSPASIDVVGMPRLARGGARPTHPAFAPRIAGADFDASVSDVKAPGWSSRWCRGFRDRGAPSAASLSGYFWLTGILTAPLATTSNRSFGGLEQVLALGGVVC